MKDLIRCDVDLAYPPFVDLALRLLAACQARGATYYWMSGYRTPEAQLALWQRGRNAAGAVVSPKDVVTRLKFGFHNVGGAGDFVRDRDLTEPGIQASWARKDYDVLAEEAKRLGLEAGHSWASFPDSPHVQLPFARHYVTASILRGLHAKGGVEETWRHLDGKRPWG